MKKLTLICHVAAVLIAVLLGTLSSCNTIDDDLSDCGNDYQLDYELKLVTNMTTELSTELTTVTEVGVANALRNHLSDIFTDFAHDVDLSFYDTQKDSIRLQHDPHIMDDNQASYTLYLPMRQYMHLAVANVIDNPLVSLKNDDYCHTSCLKQTAGKPGVGADTISSHNTGIFTARLPMEVLEGVDQSFNVHLYMVNCAASLVVDTVGSGLRDLRVLTTGFATGFRIADSTYIYSNRPPVVQATSVPSTTAGEWAFCSVNFPSPEDPATRTVIETEEPFVSSSSENSLWEIQVYATLPDGSITETILYINDPLRAGQLKVLKAKANADGSMTPSDKRVGVSVILHWNSGGHWNPEL